MLSETRPLTAVLIVDDDPDFRALICAFLPPAEYSIAEAADGAIALRRLQESTFDLIVVDLVMPEREGLELLPVIRRRWAGSRILAVSGAANRTLYLKAARLLGADLTLEKPITRAQFHRCIQQLLCARNSS